MINHLNTKLFIRILFIIDYYIILLKHKKSYFLKISFKLNQT